MDDKQYLRFLTEAAIHKTKPNPAKILQIAVTRINKKNGIDVSKDGKAMSRIKGAVADAIKKYMSDPKINSISIKLPFLTRGKDGPVHFNMTLSGTEV